MKDIKQIVNSDIVMLLCEKSLSSKEIAVVGILCAKWGDKHVKQKDIAEHRYWTETMEETKSEHPTMDSMTRDIRRIIRGLRVTHKLPILHDVNGHFLPETKEDLEQFIQRLESEAKGRAASSMETYKVMKETLGVSSPLFEELDFVGNQLIKQV